MAPLIPDGTYYIRNGQYSNLVATIIFPHRPIVAFPKYGFDGNSQWRIINVGDGGNQIFIESVRFRGNFAEAQESPGSELVGSPYRTLWTVVKLDGGKYAIQSPNPGIVWLLREGRVRAPIILNTPSGRDDAKWYFDPVNE